MPQRTVRFKISQDGLVEESVEGVAGPACHQLTERLEEALGVVQHREPTTEAYLYDEIQAETISTEQFL